MRQAIELPLSKNNLSISRINMSIKEKKLGGRPKLASYQKRTKCFRVMFTENDYIYIQSKAEQAGLSVNEFCHQAAMDCQVCQRISPEMVSAIRDLSGIANNVNQLAHQANARGEATRDEITEAARLVRQMARLVRDTL